MKEARVGCGDASTKPGRRTKGRREGYVEGRERREDSARAFIGANEGLKVPGLSVAWIEGELDGVGGGEKKGEAYPVA